MSVNKAIIVGNLGADPEKRTTDTGTTVANLRVATNRTWTDDSGQTHDETEWHRVTAFGRLAENCIQYLDKGRQVYVEGRLQTREWTTDDGDTRSTTEIVASKVDFLSGGSDGGAPGGRAPGPSGGGGDTEPFDDDEIPF